MITQKHFGTTADGREVLAFTLGDEHSYATVLDLGGILQSLVVPDRKGKPVDVVLGYDDVKGYETHGGYLGALIGRFGNRIEKGKLTLDGKEYSLFLNDRGNHLHGGKRGFDKKTWAHKIEGDVLVLTYTSPDGEENYPGELSVEVRYTFSKGELGISYRAETTKKTAVNLTNHAYFNLNGAGNGSTLFQSLMIESDMITSTDETLIPHGGYRMVAGTPFDFTSLKTIGKEISADDIDIRRGKGYDHCFVLRNKCGEFARAAVAESGETGIRMTVFTDLPALQFYAGNGLNADGKGGHYGAHAGFALETQAIPNNVNVPEYAARGSSVLDRGEVYSTRTVYKFDLL